jgi:putative transposase
LHFDKDGFAVKRKRFSVEQIVAVLKQAELGMAASDIIHRVGISGQTFYRWKKQCAGVQSDQVRELKRLQDENARLKRLVAEFSLDKAVLHDVAAKGWRGPCRRDKQWTMRNALWSPHATGQPFGKANA